MADDQYDYEINPRAVEQLFREQKLDDALKAVAAATQYQGMRGYQQSLKDGMAADKAMAKYGPMIFYKAPAGFGSAQRALTPPVMTPDQSARNALARERFEFSKTNPASAKGLQDYVIERTGTIPNPNTRERRTIPTINTTNFTSRVVSPRGIVPPTTTAAPTAPVAPQYVPPKAATNRVNQVTRKLKDGRRAIFNADTKAFIRLAD